MIHLFKYFAPTITMKKHGHDIKVTNLVKFYTLLLLQERQKHGYEIIKEISGKIEKKVSSGEIYPFLKMLVQNGYVKARKTGKREKKVYFLTPEGKKFLKVLLNRFGDLIDIAIEPKLTKCAHCGCNVYKGGYKKSVRGKEMMFCCSYCAGTFK